MGAGHPASSAPLGAVAEKSGLTEHGPVRAKGRRRGRRRASAGEGTGHAKIPSGQARSEAAAQGLTGEDRASLPAGGVQTRQEQSSPAAPGDVRADVRADMRTGLRPGVRATSGRGVDPLYAALDLGTNNCRLLIARPDDRGFRVVDAYSRIVRLGEGVGSTGLLSTQAMDRAVEALDICQRKLEERGVARARLIATEACRAAANGLDFIERVRAETGMTLEVVSRETEARLAVAGCVTLVDPAADGVILFDIGGGSSEIVWLDLRNRCGARGFALTRFIRSWASLPVGVVNLAERHGGVDVTPEVFEAMVRDVEGHLAGFALGEDLSAAIRGGGVHMLGTSGTVTTLAGVQLGLKRYDRRRVDGAWLESGQVSEMIDRLRQMSYEERVNNPCIGADRADLVLAGCAILEAIRRRWNCERLRVADRGLREGILTELMAADGVWSKGKGGRWGSRNKGKT
nr:Ppx/GppA phosphatase family protein [Roseibium aestuarii]